MNFIIDKFEVVNFDFKINFVLDILFVSISRYCSFFLYMVSFHLTRKIFGNSEV